ncbi:MAG: PAS domain S-box protein [Firmicutes bacterium]|nr:PAS domain S-box protein [Bacillota bacterium]
MDLTIFAVAKTTSVTFLLLVVYVYLYRQGRERYIGIWTVGWACHLVKFGLELWIIFAEHTATLLIASQSLSLLSSLFLLWGTYVLTEKPMLRRWLYVTLLGIGWATIANLLNLPLSESLPPILLLLGIINIWTGTKFIVFDHIENFSRYFVGFAFYAWGAFSASLSFIDVDYWLSPWGYYAGTVFAIVVAVGMLLIHMQKLRRTFFANQERFRLLAENARDVIYRYELVPTPRMDFISSSAYASLGYSPEDFYADPELLFKIIHADDRPILEAEFNSPSADLLVLRWTRKDGNIVWAEHQNVPIFDEEGNLIAIEGIARNITDRKVSEDLLRESQERYRCLVELSPDAIIVHSGGSILYANDACIRLFGADSLDQILSKSIMDFVHPDYHEVVKGRVRELLQGKAVSTIEEKLIRLDGEIIDAEVSSAPVIHEGKPAVQVVVRDITDRKHAEEKLRLFSKVVEEAPDGVQITDLNGNIIYSNKAITEIFGYYPEECKGMNVAELNADPEFPDRVIRPSLKKVGSWSGEVMLKHKEGCVFPVLLSASIVRDKKGNPTAMVGIVKDITEWKRAERELEFKSLLLDSATDSVFVHDQDGNFIYVNEVAYKSRGYTREEIFKMSLQDIVAPEYRETIKQHIELIKTTGDAIFETVHLKKDGSLMQVEVHARSLEYEGRMTSVSVVRDITWRKKTIEALERERNFNSTVLNTIGALVVVLDHEGRILMFNRACEETTGYKFEEVRGKYVFDVFILPEEREAVKRVFSDLKAGMFPNSFENYWRTKDGGRRLISWSNTCLVNANGDVEWVIPTGIDVTERKRADVELRKLSQAVEQSPNMVIIADTEGKIEYVNPRFCDTTGFRPEEVLGRNIRELKPADKVSEEHARLLNMVLAGGEWEGEFAGRRSNGEEYWESASLTPIKNEDGEITHILAILQDVTERKHAEERINHIAYYDSLTELPNRALFNDRLSIALNHAHHHKGILALLYLDLDSFKTINDTLGHDVGDGILKEVAKRLKKCISEDSTIARFGGDEFVILLPQVNSAEDAAKTAQEIFEVMKPPFVSEERELYITTSIGISLYPYDGKDTQTLLRNAEVALYRAKEQSRNKYQLYTASMNAKAFERLALENDMRKALQKGEFTVYYQPVIDINTGRLVSMEALIRWQHPSLGLVSPADFIPIAEETGFILQIDEWVLRKACEQAKVWQDEGHLPVCISVNLSAKQFQQQNLVDIVEQVLTETGLDSHYLELEITESAIMQDIEEAIAMMKRLKERNIRIAIDDFGTGYSSLSYLKQFPIDRLKIDRIFMHKLISDTADTAIVSAITMMARSLGLRSVAEGVETAEQLEALRSLGCDEMQGFLFSPPLPKDKISDLLSKQSNWAA